MIKLSALFSSHDIDKYKKHAYIITNKKYNTNPPDANINQKYLIKNGSVMLLKYQFFTHTTFILIKLYL